MPVNAERIRADIEAIARCTATPGNGATRPTFSDSWGKARDYVIEQARDARCEVRIDAAGNVHARSKSLDKNSRVWLCGSHIDSVPNGGDYDGVGGVVVALELLRSAADDDIQLPLELVVFAEEEGPTFGLGMLGSRTWVGELNADSLAQLKNLGGQNYLQAGEKFGVSPQRLDDDRIDRDSYFGLIEVHIEQGPGMWRRDQKLALVRAIAGRRQYQVTILGQANHAGATSMSDRHDALAAAAHVIASLRSLAHELAGDCVITVGRIENYPNAVNVVPAKVEFTIDFRAPDDAILSDGGEKIGALIDSVKTSHGVEVRREMTESIPARPMNSRLLDSLQSAARLAGFEPLPITVSGALHDSAILSPHIPTAMLFVPSRGGISHNPAEFSRFEDIAAAAKVVEKLVRRPAIEQLNQMSHEKFVSICGRFFEHSPWIAQRAWDAKPFSSLADLAEKFQNVVSRSSEEERTNLIRAHPDLVGRLAREGKLTRESTAEQRSAGLSDLSDDELAAFEKFNAEYRAKFGFPFIICARENRKQSILAAFPLRLKNSREKEIDTALSEIHKIARLRMNDALMETD